MNTFNNIRKMIESLEYYVNYEELDIEIIMKAQYKISVQFETAAQAQWSKIDLKKYIENNDVIEFLNDSNAIVSDNFRDDIREIQKEIIDFFGEE